MKNKIFKIYTFTLISLLIVYISLYLIAFLYPKLYIPKTNSYLIYDINDNPYENNGNDWISLKEINPNLINATLSIEDKRFYSHHGFDFLRIIKALYTNFINGKTLEGASTITQQYAKNLYLTFDKKLSRKIEEAWLTLRLETHYSKDEILEGYLNTINYGGVFGIENASQYYFGKSSKDLNIAEASILAGIPKSPSNYEPINNKENSKRRQLLVLNAMVKNNYINNEEKDMAYNVELTYVANNTNSDKITSIMYYQDAVIEELQQIKEIPKSFLATGGLKIYTNLDLNAQASLEKSFKKNITDEEIQAAGVLMNPDNGAILALMGGTDYIKSQYNRAIYSKRQVGSTMKPFLYYAALENGMTATSTFKSEKTTFVFSNNNTYMPQNFGDQYPNKDITMISAIAYSDNIFAVKTHLFLGEENLVNIAKRLGIKSNLEPIPSLALGSKEINLLEMTKAYSTFANEGYDVKPYFIRKVVDIYGNTLYEHEDSKEKILDENYVFIINDMLTATYDEQLIDYQYPTCYVIKPRMTHKYSVKTGTTDSDYLIFGYNKLATLGIWAGYDDNRSVSSTGGFLVKSIWVDAIEDYLKDKEDVYYEIPKDVIGVLVDPTTGKLATMEDKHRRIVYYIKGSEPQ